MDTTDLNFMQQTVDLASQCTPIKESIPKVGAIIVANKEVIGRGFRGSGKDEDDDHAELRAIRSVKPEDLRRLAGATLYTTLEPCTREVRSRPEQCCTELIHQHKLKRVFVGILDPNQGVTGKGLLRLQDSNVEIALFPHELSQKIQVQNAGFIRSQQTLGATILLPKEGASLRTYESGGKHPVRFKCLNPPGANTYLLVCHAGMYWPQPGPFRHVDGDVWEIDAYFSGIGEHVLHLVTASDLGNVLIGYYRKVVERNRARRERLRGKVDLALLGGDYPPIEMNGLQKGLRSEELVSVSVVPNIILRSTLVEPATIARGAILKITYEIECFENIQNGIWLGSSFQDSATEKLFFNRNQDKPVSLVTGITTHQRDFTISNDAPLGPQMLRTNVWFGAVGNSNTSKHVASRDPTQITII